MRSASPEARRLRAEGRLRFLLLALLVIAPLPFGAVEDWSRFGLITLLGLGFAYFLWAGVPLALRRREKAAVGVACLYLLWLALQLVPLPPSLLATLSPAADRLYRIGVPGYGANADGSARGVGAAAGTDPRGYAYPDLARYTAAGGGGQTLGWVTPTFNLRRSLSLYPYGTFTIFCQTAALLAFVVMGLSLFGERRERRRLALTLLGIAAFEAIYGIFETVTGHQQIFMYRKIYYTDAATGTLINRNHYAGLLNMTLPLAMALALDRGRGGAPGPRGLPLRVRIARALTPGGERRPLLLFATIMMGVAVVLSRSRMGISALLAALVAMSGLLAWKSRREEDGAGHPLRSVPSVSGRSRTGRPRRRAASITAAILPMALLLGIVVYSFGTDLGPTVERFFQIRDDLEGTVGRPALWAATLPVVRDFFLTGAGAGAYVFALNPSLKTLPGRNFWYYDHAHNDYLEAPVTLGIIGVALAAVALALFIIRRPRSLTSLAALVGLATLALHSVVDFLLAIPSNALLACALLCLYAGRRSAAEMAGFAPGAGIGARAGSPPGLWRRAAALLVLAAVALGPGRALAAAATFRPYWNSSPDRAVVAEALQTAVWLDPWNDTYPRKLAESEQEIGRQKPPAPLVLGEDLEQQVRARQVALVGGIVTAHAHLVESIDRNPLDYEIHADLAESASTTREMLREVGLMSRANPSAPATILVAPHLASVALAPRAYGNQASMGWLLWSERAELGDEGTAKALELLRAGLTDPVAPPFWIDAVLRSVGDTATLASIDATLHPPSAAYARLLSQSSLTTSTSLFFCVGVFQGFAAVRESVTTLSMIAIRPYPLDDDSKHILARVRDTLVGSERAIRRLTLAQTDHLTCSPTTSPSAMAALAAQIDQTLATIDSFQLDEP